jgi:hypothetical protein
MKFNIIFTAVIAIIVFAWIGCTRDLPSYAPYTGTGTEAFIKVVHAAPSVRTIFGVPDSLNLYVGSVKVNAIAANTANGHIVGLSYGGIYPTTTNSYTAVPSGAQSIRLTVNGISTQDSVTIVTLQKNLIPGGYYSLIVTDSVNSARDSSKIWLQDVPPVPTAGRGFVYYRFINAVMNDTAGTTVDLYSQRRNQILFPKVAIGSTTAFTSFPTMLGVLDTLYVRRTGTTNILAKLLPTASLTDQRMYTFIYEGNTIAATGTKVKALISYNNF